MAKYRITPSSKAIIQLPISIGHKAEKGVEAIEFDLTAWVETYGSGTATIIMRRWGDAIPYPIALEIDENNKATWTLSDIDTAKAGMAYAQLNYIVGDDVVKKSDIYTFRVMDSLVGEGEPPEAYESWLEHLTHLAAEAMAEVLDIEGVATDKTLTVDGGIADAKATGDALALKADKSTTYTKTEVDQMIEDVEVETDTTLEISGAPADAKKVGDELSALKADLDDVQADLNSTFNNGAETLYTDLSLWNNGYFSSSGILTTSNQVITPLSMPIELKAYKSLVIDPNGLTCNIALYTYNGTSYSRKSNQAITTKASFVFTEDWYVTFQFKKNPQSNISPREFTGIIGLTPDWFDDITKNKIAISSLETDVSGIKTQISDLVITKTIGNNLYKDSDLITNYWYYVGSSVNTISLTPVANNGGYGAIKLAIAEGQTNLSIGYRSAASARAFYAYYFVTDDGTILSRGSISLDDAKQGVTLTIPSGAKYWLGSMTSSLSFNGNLMINYGSTLPWEQYEEYFFINGYRLANKSELDADMQSLQEQIDNITPMATAVLKLPEKVEMIAGEDFELFYKGICNAIDTDLYDFEFTYTATPISNTKAWKRKLTASPVAADVGTHAVTVVVRDNTGEEIDTGTFDLVVNAVPASPASEKVVLCMGDSLTTSGGWVKELKRRLTANDGTPTGFNLSNINFIGTCESNGTRFEGYGGWTFTSYSTANESNAYMWITCTHDKTDSDQHAIYNDTNNVQWKLETIESGRIKLIRVSSSGTLPASGTLTWVSGGESQTAIVYSTSEQAAGNPFWSETLGRNDFKIYASQFGVNHIDHCIILLGWNSTGTNETYYKGIVRTFIDSLLDETYGFPNCKITFVGLQVPSRDGMANNYGTGWKYYTKLQHVWNLQEWYQELVSEEYQTAEFVCLSAQFDTDYNCITSQMDVNLRNTQKVTIQTNAVHPAPAGYLEIADAICRNLVGRL